jgi:hypothetical protein
MLELLGASKITPSGGISPTTSVIRAEASSASYPENHAAHGVLAAALAINLALDWCHVGVKWYRRGGRA